jgi:23S rRNA (guanosine2251-2'-O)-methyltransferase
MIKKKESSSQFSQELIYGLHPVIELLKAKRRKLITLYTTKPTPKGWQDIEKLMPKYPVAIQYVDREILSRMVATTDHQGVVAWTHAFPFRKQMFEPKKQRFLLMLDGIQDSRNLGAILRSAYCTGVDGVIITKKSSAPLTATALKSSAGLAEHLDIMVAASAQEAAQIVKQAGYPLYLATFSGTDATKVSFEQPLCLVIGGEGFGISKSILSTGQQVTLPQKTTDISYNASVAAGVLLFLIATQNKKI